MLVWPTADLDFLSHGSYMYVSQFQVIHQCLLACSLESNSLLLSHLPPSDFLHSFVIVISYNNFTLYAGFSSSSIWLSFKVICVRMVSLNNSAHRFVLQEDKAFPPAAVKHYHVKPQPSREMRPVQPKHTLNQPKHTIRESKHTIREPKHTMSQPKYTIDQSKWEMDVANHRNNICFLQLACHF